MGTISNNCRKTFSLFLKHLWGFIREVYMVSRYIYCILPSYQIHPTPISSSPQSPHLWIHSPPPESIEWFMVDCRLTCRCMIRLFAHPLPPLCRGGYFLLPNREWPSPGSLISIKRCTVQRGEGTKKNIGPMSCKFREIVKKLYLLWKWAKPSHMHSVPPPPPPSQSAGFGGGFSTWWSRIRQENAPWRPAMASRHF